jgi:hypothetical protein
MTFSFAAALQLEPAFCGRCSKAREHRVGGRIAWVMVDEFTTEDFRECSGFQRAESHRGIGCLPIETNHALEQIRPPEAI